MINKTFKKEIIFFLILMVPFFYLFLIWNKLPEQIPIHWNLGGEVDNFGSKYFLNLLPLFNILIYLFLLVVPKIDPKKINFTIFSASYYKIRLTIILIITILITFVFAIAAGIEMNMPRIISIGFFLFIAIFGNYLGTIRPNYFVGIRTPWTLNNENVWRKTHFLAGKLWFWCGLLCFIISFFLTNKILYSTILIIFILIILIPILYSFIIYRKVKIRQL